MAIIGFVLVSFGLLALALQRFYSCVPAKELKRLATRGDHLAASLYSPVAYGTSMRLLLWLVFGLSLAGGLLLLAYSLAPWAEFVVMLLSVAAVIWLLSVRLTVHSARLAVTVAPALKYVLEYTHPGLKHLGRLIGRLRSHTPHSGLYEKEDLLALLKQQKEQVDNRIRQAELDLMGRAAKFGDLKASDLVQSWKEIPQVSADDHIGPILLGELHKSGQSSFVVYRGTPESPVGTLFLRDAVHAKAGGLVGDVMRDRLCFVHEDFSLRQVLSTFVQTGQLMVVVVDQFKEAVGVITLKGLLEYLLGEPESGDEDASVYENRDAVAAFRPEPELQPVQVPAYADEPLDDGQNPSPDQTEVVK